MYWICFYNTIFLMVQSTQTCSRIYIIAIVTDAKYLNGIAIKNVGSLLLTFGLPRRGWWYQPPKDFRYHTFCIWNKTLTF